MFKVVQRFGKHRNCHLQGKCIDWMFMRDICRKVVGGERDMTSLIGGAEEHVCFNTF
jgi:hypothetical protein